MNLRDPADRRARRVVASADRYEDAEAIVNRLVDDGFPVEHLVIVGRDLRYVEQVTGHLNAWKAALGLQALQPNAIDHYDSGQLILEAAAQGLGIAVMHDDHLKRNNDPRLAKLYDVEIKSPYSYWFVCRKIDLESRPVRIFHDWLVNAEL